MADRFYGAAVGAQFPIGVTEAASTTSAAVEVRVSDTAYADKGAVIRALDAIKMHLLTKETQPIA